MKQQTISDTTTQTNITNPQAQQTTFVQYLDGLSQWEKDLVGNATPIGDSYKILHKILTEENGTRQLRGATDGGMRTITRQYGSA